jgi:two-component system, NarL family, sensor kinase
LRSFGFPNFPLHRHKTGIYFIFPAHKSMSARRVPTERPASGARKSDVNENALQALLDGLEVGIAYLSSSGKIFYCNPRFAELLGYPARKDLSGITLQSLVSVDCCSTLLTAFSNAQHGPVEGELQVDAEDRKRFLRLSLGPLDSRTIAGAQIRATAIETTDLVEANRAVRERENVLRSLTARILQVQDNERRRIARDLHDVTAQEIAAISMSLGSFMTRAECLGPDFKSEIGDAMDLLRKVQDEIRTLSYVLHPPLLDERGLASALQWYIDGFKKRSGIDVDLKVPKNLERLPIEKEIALFRVVQEGLTNVLRHSKSNKAEICVSITDGHVELSVRDEGKGIEPRKLQIVESSRAEFGVGIPGMRERLSQFSGTLELSSNSSGTQLTARVPVSDAQGSGPTEKPAPVARKRILIADDHEVTRQGIKVLLSVEPSWEICGEAHDGLDAVAKTKALYPDLVILDLSMPNMGGLSAAQQIRSARVPTKLLVFTTHDYSGLQHILESAGCDGYVQKARAGSDLVTGVRAVLAGERFFSPPPSNDLYLARGASASR